MQPGSLVPPALGSWFRRATAMLRPLPDFVVIGAQRAGTTSLFNALLEQPAITGPREKEVHFFDHDWGRGPTWYRSRFPLRRGAQAVGEATPYYLFHAEAAARMHELLPHAKLVVLMREPAARAYSHYRHEVRMGIETLGFEEALAAEEARLAADTQGTTFNHQHFSYVARGRYAEQLRVWLALFPREQMLVVRSEDFYARPGATLAEVCAFLGVPYDPSRPHPHLNASEEGDPPEAALAPLRARFRTDNETLEQLLGVTLAWS